MSLACGTSEIFLAPGLLLSVHYFDNSLVSARLIFAKILQSYKGQQFVMSTLRGGVTVNLSFYLRTPIVVPGGYGNYLLLTNNDVDVINVDLNFNSVSFLLLKAWYVKRTFLNPISHGLFCTFLVMGVSLPLPWNRQFCL